MINSFRGKYFFLSNMYPYPHKKEIQNLMTGEKRIINLTCAEADFQIEKTFDFNEKLLFDNASGMTAKRIGRKVKLDPRWNDKRLGVMYQALYAKFADNPYLKEKLLATGDEELVEGNTWGDTYWGVCDGKGENHLGKILMELRMKFRMEE